MAYGQVAAGAVTSVILWVQAPRRPRLRLPIPAAQLRFFLGFAWPLWLGGLLGAVATNGLNFEVQVFLGLALLGYFRLAVGLGDRIDRAELVLAQVLVPVLSRTRDAARLRRAFDASARLILLWAVPAGLGLAFFAEDIVRYVLGSRWQMIVPLLRVEGVGETVNAVGTMWRRSTSSPVTTGHRSGLGSKYTPS